MQPDGRQIRVRGIVQGVGFRPAVWRLARQFGLAGQVCNDGQGVLIRAWGDAQALNEFARRVRSEAPPLARVDSVYVANLPQAPAPVDFRIVVSNCGAVNTSVVPDAATCPDCRVDIEDSSNRRYRYPFANCTHCGPRLSILRAVPYDRCNTTMAAFAMCADCLREYEDPTDRRFHAQPSACPVCGPRLWLEDSAGRRMDSNAVEATEAARSALRAGRIVAVKGLGGFHLACNALDGDAVARLRSLKRRYQKPLALMARSVDVIRRYAEVSSAAAALLSQAAAPIVILSAIGAEQVAPQVAPGVACLGFMLPYTPLHHLLLRGLDTPIVLTSGNLSDEPQCTNNDEARRTLGPIADAFLMHDRDIATRLDDSVARVVGGEARVLRRARGYAPAPITLPEGFEHAPDLLAMGGELKNSFCLLKDGQAIVSQHIGDLEAAKTHADYQKNLELFAGLFDHRPAAIAIDLHPDYLASKLGRDRAKALNVPLEEIQHHHAHIAACMAENDWPLHGERVLGVALDGLGYGADQQLWGGEFLLADYRGFERFGRFMPVAMIGGAQAIREPWRSAYAHLSSTIGWGRFERDYSHLNLFHFLSAKARRTLDAMLDSGINCPLVSSCGRLFDAVAASLDVCRERTGYEGQAAIELEAIARAAALLPSDAGYPFEIDDNGAGPMQLNPAPLWVALLNDLRDDIPSGVIALRFHRGLARAVVEMVRRIRRSGCAQRFEAVALTGGVFQNCLLFEAVREELIADGLIVLAHRQVPSHDGGLSLGQAAVAAARLITGTLVEPPPCV